MAVMNLLKANWIGKMGNTVGSKWKDKSVIKTYTIPTYTDTPAQQKVRRCFKDLSKALSMITLQLKPYSALDTRSMSLRNAIIKLNKDLFQQNAFEYDEILLSKGGLPNVANVVITIAQDRKKVSMTWDVNKSAIISDKAKMIIVIARPGEEGIDEVVVSNESYKKGKADITIDIDTVSEYIAWVYILDYRGSAKTASKSYGTMFS